MASRKKTTNSSVVELEYPLFPVKADWRPPSLSDLPRWGEAKRIGIDTETRDDFLRDLGPGVRRGGQMIGVSFAIEDGPGAYLPLDHFGGDNVDREQALRYLRDQARAFRGVLVGANIPYDLDYLAQNDITFPNAQWIRDVQIADPLIYELHLSYSLEEICARYGLPGKDETLLRAAAEAHKCDPKSQMWKLPARYVGGYAETDARRPLQILRKQERRIEDLGLQRVYDLESRLTPVLLKMRRRGVRVDMEKLAHIEQWSLEEEHRAISEIHRLSGRSLGLGDVNKASALAPILRDIGVVLGKTKASEQDKIDKDVLGSINHPVAALILRARKVNKLRTTFAASVRKYETHGRIHCTINQLRGQRDFESDGTKGAAFGRCSCSDPNLQQQPARDDFAAEWRSIYLPEEGALWASVDYSQQEPRMAVHFAVASGPRLIGQAAYEAALKTAEGYRNDPRTDFHDSVVAMTGNLLTRKQSKPVGLGIMYGMGEAKMCLSIGLPLSRAIYNPETHERVYEDANPHLFAQLNTSGSTRGRAYPAAGAKGREVIARFDAAVPYIRALAQACQARARETGIIRTLSGRICHFPEIAPQDRRNSRDKYQWLHKALNRVIQGSSGDQMKQALVDLDAAGHFLQLQIHDEATMSVANWAEAHEAARIMENAIPMHLPFRCDVEVGTSWGQAK